MRAKTVAWQSVLGIPSEVDRSPDIHLLVRRSHHRAIVRQIDLPREIRRQSSSEESQIEQYDFSRVGLVIASE
jgi:hypothetical protein